METSTSREWLSIDVGIVHLGLVLLRMTAEFAVEQIVWHQLVDIRRVRHSGIKEQDCRLGHTSTITDRMAHVYQEHAEMFNRAERILVERQPITGLQAVQESLFAAYRDRMVLVSPNAMHRALKLRGNYEARKVQSVNFARHYFYSISNPIFPAGKALIDAPLEVATRFESYLDKTNKVEKRSHDIADAICIAVYLARVEAERLAKKRRKEDLASRQIGDLNQYRRVPKFTQPIRILRRT